jgi:hypothetical protein
MSADGFCARRAAWVTSRNAEVAAYHAKQADFLARRKAGAKDSDIPFSALSELSSFECAYITQGEDGTGIEQIEFGADGDEQGTPLFRENHTLSQRWDRLILAFDALILDPRLKCQGEMIDIVTGCEEMLYRLEEAGHHLRTGITFPAAALPAKAQDDGDKFGGQSDSKVNDKVHGTADVKVDAKGNAKVDTEAKGKKGKKRHRKKKPRVK